MTEKDLKYTLHKEERLYAQKRIDALFSQGESFISYPLRVVFVTRKREEQDVFPSSILVSVSKKRFKRAVKRNRVKRLIKEAYRLNKHMFISNTELSFDIAFLYLKNELPQYSEIEKAILKTANILRERFQHEINDADNP